MSVDRIEWGFTVPENDRKYGPMSEKEARSFTLFHPGCKVIKRRVQIGDWEESQA